MSENTYKVSEVYFAEKDGYKLALLPTKQNKFLHNLNQQAPLEVHFTKNGQYQTNGQLNFELFWDNQTLLEKGTIDLTGKPIQIPINSDKPGCIQLFVSTQIGSEELKTGCGQGFGIELLKPSMEPPKDFHEFWTNKKRLLDSIPMQSKWAELNKNSHPQLHDYSHKAYIQSNTENTVSHFVTIPSVGNPVQGILTMPKNPDLKNCPAILCVHGAGVVPTQPHNYLKFAQEGAIVLEINAHGIPNDQKESYYQDLLNGSLNGYSKRNADNPNLFYFHDMFLRLTRAVSFLKSLPEWNQKSLFVRGSSQGGAQAIACAYLNQDITGFIATVPGFCDHTAATINRVPGWPSIAPLVTGQTPNPKIIESLRYYDATNFLRFTKAEGFFSASLIDGTCKPTSIYTAYNAHIGQHQMIHQPYTAHQNLDSTITKSNEFMWENIARNS